MFAAAALTVLALTGLPSYAGASAAGWPLIPRPEVVARFDPPSSAWGAGHRGVDLLGTPGQTVRSAQAGTVTFAATLAGRGVVVVAHGELRTTYEPVQAEVHVGDRLAAGQPIGRLQLAMSHCFPRACLHWGLLRDSTYRDPLTLVGVGPVRLLPLASAPVPVSVRSVRSVAAPDLAPTILSAVESWRLTPSGGPAGRPVGAFPW
jgi:murein DD-endopeptidase MepM/ murein hydrolase activator NlpD